MKLERWRKRLVWPVKMLENIQYLAVEVSCPWPCLLQVHTHANPTKLAVTHGNQPEPHARVFKD
jgi:hypothetical protein